MRDKERGTRWSSAAAHGGGSGRDDGGSRRFDEFPVKKPTPLRFRRIFHDSISLSSGSSRFKFGCTSVQLRVSDFMVSSS
ncbi:hypothetical protein HanPI659440_Chr17g0691811 [Helianthus annuus]|nr:hypothetical protein HanPI659440_Chr17g0691811 [Helianthus annuus]